jgi:hypothetical protein
MIDGVRIFSPQHYFLENIAVGKAFTLHGKRMSLLDSYRFIDSDEYRLATAEQKRDMMWEAMVATPYDILPPNTFNFAIVMSYVKTLSRSWLQEAFTDHNENLSKDVRPPRTKSFSAYSAVAKVKVVIENTSQGYTGFFETGGIGIARLTIVMDVRWYMPGMSIKFFVDRCPSESLMLGPSLDPQNPNKDYFAFAHTNRMPVPRRLPFAPAWSSGFADWHMGAISDPLANELDNLALTNQQGERIGLYKTPYQIFLEPTPDVHIDPDSDADFRMELGRFQTGTILYNITAKETKESEPVYLGYVQTESDLITSRFADRVFAQRHRTLPYKPLKRVPPTLQIDEKNASKKR